MASASVLIAIVLASPGTPSTSRCPRASSATTIRSSRWSCPTMTFLTSYSRRSMGRALGVTSGSRSTWSVLLGSVRGQAGGAAGDVDGHGQADADEHVLLGGIDQRGHDADDGPVGVHQRSAGVPRVDRGVHLDEAADDLSRVLAPERAVQAGHDARAHGAGEAEGVADDVGVAADR